MAVARVGWERGMRETGDDIMRGLTPDRFIVDTTQRAFKTRGGSDERHR